MGALMAVLGGLGSLSGSSTLAGIGLGLSAGTQILSGLSGYGEGQAQVGAYNANAQIARQQAVSQAAQERAKFARLASQQRAAFGASGVDVNVGSPLDVLADTDAEGAVSAMQMLYSGELEAANWKQRARAAKGSARGGLLSGIVGGLGTGLLGASKMGWLGGGGSGAGAGLLGTDSYNSSLSSVVDWWRK